jgi:hypothetical protein
MGPDPHEAEERKMRASEAKRMTDQAEARRSRALVLDEVAEQEAARLAAAAETVRRKQSMDAAVIVRQKFAQREVRTRVTQTRSRHAMVCCKA